MSLQYPVALKDLSPVLFADSALEVTGICSDSRKVNSGDLFVALKGYSEQTGADYAQDAVKSGALAVISDVQAVESMSLDVPVAFDPELTQKLSSMAGKFYGHPSQDMEVIGITGTNGKTTCCYWLSWVLKELGLKVGQIGTLGAGVLSHDAGNSIKPTGFTTPDAIQVQQLLSFCKESNAEAVVMEVSSHGLDQDRASAVRFNAAIFTNFTQDHLDYHKTMAEYLQAKLKLFKFSSLKTAIVNMDESVAQDVTAVLSSDIQLVQYSLSDASVDLYFSAIEASINESGVSGYQLEVAGNWGTASFFAPVLGEYNLSNLLAVIAAALVQGFELQEICKALSQVPSVPGRMQQVTLENEAELNVQLPKVVIDFAHTPNAVESVLTALRAQTEGRLVVVLGCGGNRDQAKRAPMASIAADLSDAQVFTADNPRDEEIQDILDDMMSGLTAEKLEDVVSVVDRESAIEQAIKKAGSDDIVAILGKGHEQYQEVKGHKLPFSDEDVAHSALQKLAQELEFASEPELGSELK